MKILIIDDEPLIHISIEKLLQKYSDEIEVFHAYHGQEIQQLMKKHDFHIAYVDIKLPGISGLETIQLAKKVSPHTIYYIMTSFDSFAYAKEAIRLKVEDYLLKPLDYETIKSSVDTARKLRQNYTRERKNVFRYWLNNILNERSGSLEPFEDYYIFSIVMTMDQADMMPAKFSELLMPYDDNFVSAFSGNHIILLCFSESAETLRNISKLVTSDSCISGTTLFVSSIAKNDQEIKTAIRSSLELSSLRILLGIENCYSLKPLLSYDPKLLKLCQRCESWQRAYHDESYNEFMDYSKQICSELNQEELPKKYFDNMMKFFQTITRDTSALPRSPLELPAYFQKFASQLLEPFGTDRLIESIIQYIQKNFCDDISTAMLSEQFGLSANYITNLLKQKLGIRYSDYITQLRMERAKQLLTSTDLSVKNITTKCGYYSQSHFTKMFVEHEKCTPIEFRKKSKLDLH